MRFPVVSLALMFVALVVPRPLAGQAAPAPDGCYLFPRSTGGLFFWWTREPWARMLSDHRSELVEFTQTQLDSGSFQLRTPGMRDTVALREFAGSAWRRTTADSVALAWGDGFSGVALRLQIRGDSLVGTVTGFTDVWLEGQPAVTPRPVTGTKVACPLAPPRGGAT